MHLVAAELFHPHYPPMMFLRPGAWGAQNDIINMMPGLQGPVPAAILSERGCVRKYISPLTRQDKKVTMGGRGYNVRRQDYLVSSEHSNFDTHEEYEPVSTFKRTSTPRLCSNHPVIQTSKHQQI